MLAPFTDASSGAAGGPFSGPPKAPGPAARQPGPGVEGGAAPSRMPGALQKTAYNLYTLLFDAGASAVGWLGFYLIRYLLGEIHPKFGFNWVGSTLIITGFWVLAYGFTGLYRDVLRRSRIKDAATMALTAVTGIIVLIGVLMLTDGHQEELFKYMRNASLYLALHLAIGITVKVTWLTHLKNQILSGRIYFNTILVGSEGSAQEVYNEMTSNNPHLGIRFVGFVHVESPDDHLMASDLVHLGHYSHLEQIVRDYDVEQTIIATEPSEHRLTEQVLNAMEGTGTRTYVLPDMYQILLGTVGVNHILGTPLIQLRAGSMAVWQNVVKRAIDIASAFLAFGLFWWLYLIAAVMTKLSSKGPVIFSQYRIGKGGLPFRIFKFRSMYTDAERHGPKLSSGNDPRITPWGLIMRRTRLDELPQFWNVLKGDMSLVGPRPERQHFIDQIVQVAPHYKYLNRVRPGITSLGQVKFGYAENVDQMVRRLRYDIIYIENMSLAMDMRILVFTIMIVLRGKGK